MIYDIHYNGANIIEDANGDKNFSITSDGITKDYRLVNSKNDGYYGQVTGVHYQREESPSKSDPAINPDGDGIYASLVGTAGKTAGTIIYQRTIETTNSTIGTFITGDSEITGYFLEPAGPSSTKEGSDQRIPSGTYDLEPYSSAKHPDVFQITNIVGRTVVLIHPGNYPGDTEGCFLPGSSIGIDFIGGSKSMFSKLSNYINQFDSFKIIIYDPKPKHN